jgi:hypothetical protein
LLTASASLFSSSRISSSIKNVFIELNFKAPKLLIFPLLKYLS